MASWNRWSSGTSRTGSAALKTMAGAGGGCGGRQRLGQKKWEQAVNDVIARLIAALEPQDVVLGGGNVKNLKKLPSGCRAGDNLNAFVGGFRVWEKTDRGNRSKSKRTVSRATRKPGR